MPKSSFHRSGTLRRCAESAVNHSAGFSLKSRKIIRPTHWHPRLPQAKSPTCQVHLPFKASSWLSANKIRKPKMVGDFSSSWKPKGDISSAAILHSASLDQANLQKKIVSRHIVSTRTKQYQHFEGWCIRNNWQIFLRNQHFRYDGEKSEVIIYTSQNTLCRSNKKAGIFSTSRKVINLGLALNTPCLETMTSHRTKLDKK